MEPKQRFNLIGFAPRSTCADDYEVYRHTKLFLETRYRALPRRGNGVPRDLLTLMEEAGYTNRVKFVRRVAEWLTTRGRIPWQFFERLCIAPEDLCLILEFDKQQYHEALKQTRRPETFRYRLAACIYPVVTLPEQSTWERAVAYVTEFLRSQPVHVRRCGAWFSYPEKTVTISEDGGVATSGYEPAITFERNFVVYRHATTPGSVVVQ